MSETEKKIRESIFISEVPEGGTLEIRYKGKVLARRVGEGELEKP